MRRRYMISSKSTYTIISDCNGGQVYFDDKQMGTIQNGILDLKIKGNKSYTVKIVGGLRSTTDSTSVTSTSYGDDRRKEYEKRTNNLRCSGNWFSSELELTIQASFDLAIYAKTYVHSWSLDHFKRTVTTYNSPANQTIQPNSSITMNQTSSVSTNNFDGDKTYSPERLEGESNVSPTSGQLSCGWVLYGGKKYSRQNYYQDVNNFQIIDRTITGFYEDGTSTYSRSYIRINYTTTDGGYSDFSSVDFNL